MNWCQGLLRVWVVFALFYAAAVLVYDEYPIIRDAITFEDFATRSPNLMPWEHYQFEKLLKSQGCKSLYDKDLDTFNMFQSSDCPTYGVARIVFYRTIPNALGLPLISLVMGSLLYWALSGFRKKVIN